MYRFKRKVIDKRGKVFMPGATVPGDIPLFALAEMVRVGDIVKVDIIADTPERIPDADIPFAEY